MRNLAEALAQINALRVSKPDKKDAIDLIEKMTRNLYGDYSTGRATIHEALQSTDTLKLIPKIIEGQIREAAEPKYLGTNFLQTINVDSASANVVYVIPVAGELVATEVGEGTRYNEDNIEFTTVENSTLEVRVKKVGVKVSITEEAISDSSWDILGMNTRKMGAALGRYKEELIFNNFSHHGHVIFDNDLRKVHSEAGTTGRGLDGQFNDTLSVEDFLDLVLTMIAQGVNPTDVIMHPLTWLVFARNSMIGIGMSFGALGGQNVSPWNTIQGTNGPFGLQNNGSGQKFVMDPSQVQNRLPMPLTMNLSPFVDFDKKTKRFDMYCVDRSNVGILVVKQGIQMDNWTDPEKDIRCLKAKERYGVGILENGRGIGVIRHIAVAPTYPQRPHVVVDNQTTKGVDTQTV